MLNEPGHYVTWSENVYFANNEKASIEVFTAVFCFTHAEHNLIKLTLYNNWSAEAVNSILEYTMWNSIAQLCKAEEVGKYSLNHNIEI